MGVIKVTESRSHGGKGHVHLEATNRRNEKTKYECVSLKRSEFSSG